MRIICGTDFTEHAAIGTSVAAILAGKFNDRLLLVHALPGGGQSAVSPEIMKIMNSLFAILHENLAEEAARLGRLGADVEPHLVPGSPDQAILSKVVPSETRLVVVSSQGRLGSKHRLLGGVAERVAESSPVPTLVVRQDDPFVQWLRGQRPLKVLCAYDFSVTADAALAYLVELRHIGPCEIVVARVDSPWDEKKRLGIPGPMPLDANLPEIQAVLERDLREKVAAVLGDADARIRVESGLGRPDAHLIDIAKAEQADVIVTGAHQWHGLARFWHVSTSRALLHYAPMSVLVVPGAAADIKPPFPKVRRVLVAADFSDPSRHAILHACSLPNAAGTVRLVHVMHPHELPGGECAHGFLDHRFPARHAEQVKACAEKLRALIPAEAGARELTVEVEVVEHRDPVEGICQAAERFGADVICLGTHGHSGWSAALLGSVAQAVMRRSPRPLFVVHPPPL